MDKSRLPYLDLIEGCLNRNRVSLHDHRLVACWSGGKDSTALLLLLSELCMQHQAPIRALFAPYPNATIDPGGRQATVDFWHSRGVEVFVLDHDLPDPHGCGPTSLCIECKQARRRILVKSFFESQDVERMVVFTGHNSWDLAAYLIEALIGTVVSNSLSPEILSRERHLEIMNKFLEAYAPNTGPMLLRPLLPLGDAASREIMHSCGTPFPFPLIPRVCPWRAQRKRLIQQYFEQMGLEFSLNKLLAQAACIAGTPSYADFESLPFETYIL